MDTSGFCILPDDTSKESGIETPTFWLVNDLLSYLNHRHVYNSAKHFIFRFPVPQFQYILSSIYQKKASMIIFSLPFGVTAWRKKKKLEITFEITISNNFTELIISVIVKHFIKVVFLKWYCNIFHKGDRLHGEKNEIQELFNIINCNNERTHHCSKETF